MRDAFISKKGFGKTIWEKDNGKIVFGPPRLEPWGYGEHIRCKSFKLRDYICECLLLYIILSP